MVIKWSKPSNERAINWSRTYVRRIGCVAMCAGVECGRHSSSEAAATVAFATPFLLYLLCSHGAAATAEVTEAGMRSDIFHRARVPSTVISAKIRQRLAPLSPLVRRFCAGFHILCDNFFLPGCYASPPTYAGYVRHDFYALTPADKVDWLAIDERLQRKKGIQSPATEGPSPRDSVEELTAGEVNFCFPALFSDYAEWSGVELRTPECSYSRKSGLSEVVGPCLRALCSREARITKERGETRKEEAKVLKLHRNYRFR